MTSIVYRQGDLLESTHTVLLHGCNAQGVMGSGVARQIRAKWPNVYEIYSLRHRVFGLTLGDIVPVATIDGKIIVNGITQDFYGRTGDRFVDYDAVAAVIDRVDAHVGSWGVTEVAMPRIGAGLGGGDWQVIENIIMRHAKNFLPVVYDFAVAL